jgi:hypothetical protein
MLFIEWGPDRSDHPHSRGLRTGLHSHRETNPPNWESHSIDSFNKTGKNFIFAFFRLPKGLKFVHLHCCIPTSSSRTVIHFDTTRTWLYLHTISTNFILHFLLDNLEHVIDIFDDGRCSIDVHG